MRILMLSPRMPFPANSGGAVRIASIMNGLSQHFDTEFVAPIDAQEVRTVLDCTGDVTIVPIPVSSSRMRTIPKLIRFIFTHMPLHTCLYRHREARTAVSSLLSRNSYDVIYCHFAHSLEYLPSSVSIPIILDTQNDDQEYWERKAQSASGWKRILSAWNLRKVRRYEQRYMSRIWAHVSVSERDRQLAKRRTHEVVPHYLVAPNGVDTNHYTPINWAERSSDGPVTLVFLGSLNLDINVDAALRLGRDILPRICRLLPGRSIRLLIVGRNPRPIVKQLETRAPNIVVTGTVPDVKPWLRQGDILILPLREGAGTKLRVLEAMASALPVVGTEVALQGLGGEVGVHYLRAQDDAQLVRATCGLITDFDRRAMIGHSSRELMERSYDWSTITARLAEDIRAIL